MTHTHTHTHTHTRKNIWNTLRKDSFTFIFLQWPLTAFLYNTFPSSITQTCSSNPLLTSRPAFLFLLYIPIHYPRPPPHAHPPPTMVSEGMFMRGVFLYVLGVDIRAGMRACVCACVCMCVVCVCVRSPRRVKDEDIDSRRQPCQPVAKTLCCFICGY